MLAAIGGEDFEQLAFGILLFAITIGGVALVRFLTRVRDQLRDDLRAKAEHLSEQDDQLDAINRAVNHRAVGEPNLYQLVLDTKEAVVSLTGRFEEHTMNDERNFDRLDRRLDSMGVDHG